MKIVYSILLVVLTTSVLEQTLADKHNVGGSQGWDESTDFSTWASGQTFKVGDQLVFKYTAGLHSVVELASESAYKNCDVSTSVNSMTGGNDVVKLDKPGTRYFACGTPGHCGQGMKVKIETVAANGSPASPSSSSSSSSSTPSSSSSSSPASTSSSGTLLATYFGIILVLFGFQMLFFV